MKRDKTFNNDDYTDLDWALFNLLEGELDEAEAKELLTEIERSESVKNEWETIQLTQLAATPVIYKHKSKLLKNEDNRIIVLAWWKKPLKIAASIAILALFSVTLYHLTKDQSNLSNGALSHINHANEISEDAKSESYHSTAPEIKDQESNLVEPQIQIAEFPKFNNGEIKSVESVAVNVASDSSINQNLLPNVPTSEAIADIDSKTDGFSFVTSESSPEPKVSDIRVENNPTNLDQHIKEYTGIRNAMNNGLAVLVEPIRNSSLRVRKIGVKGDPGFKVEWSSDQYYAVAMVHLLPKNNR